MSTALLNLLFAQTIYKIAADHEAGVRESSRQGSIGGSLKRTPSPSGLSGPELFARISQTFREHPLNSKFNLSAQSCQSLYQALLPHSPSTPTTAMLVPLLSKMYESYKRDIIVQIKNDEQEFSNKLREIERIETGRWDAELLKELEHEKSHPTTIHTVQTAQTAQTAQAAQAHQQQQLRLQKQLELQQKQEHERKAQLHRQQLQKQQQLLTEQQSKKPKVDVERSGSKSFSDNSSKASSNEPEPKLDPKNEQTEKQHERSDSIASRLHAVSSALVEGTGIRGKGETPAITTEQLAAKNPEFAIAPSEPLKLQETPSKLDPLNSQESISPIPVQATEIKPYNSDSSEATLHESKSELKPSTEVKEPVVKTELNAPDEKAENVIEDERVEDSEKLTKETNEIESGLASPSGHKEESSKPEETELTSVIEESKTDPKQEKAKPKTRAQIARETRSKAHEKELESKEDAGVEESKDDPKDQTPRMSSKTSKSTRGGIGGKGGKGKTNKTVKIEEPDDDEAKSGHEGENEDVELTDDENIRTETKSLRMKTESGDRNAVENTETASPVSRQEEEGKREENDQDGDDEDGEDDEEDDEEEDEEEEEEHSESEQRRKRKRHPSHSPAAPTKRFQTVANPLISDISSNKSASFFANAVNPNDAPNYYDVIYSPTDLRTIKAMVKDGRIKDSAELERDLEKMFANAVMYNSWQSDISDWTREMQRETETLLALFRGAERKGRAASSSDPEDGGELKKRKK